MKHNSLAILASRDFISVSEAAKYTPYSGEYLSLLARKGKLAAVKVNRDWITTRKIVLAYVKKQQDKHWRLTQKLEESKTKLIKH